jgi:hypothetical protein
MNPFYPLVALRAYHRCEYCHAPESVFNFPFEIEHVLSVALGGVDDETNLALACRSCNIYKGPYVNGIDSLSGDRVHLFHPREQVWEQHFQINLEAGEVIGTTPTGRATVNRLRMNSPAQLSARSTWIRLGLFP